MFGEGPCPGSRSGLVVLADPPRHRHTDLARLSLGLGFVPDGNTVLPLVGVGLVLMGVVWLVVVAATYHLRRRT